MLTTSETSCQKQDYLYINNRTKMEQKNKDSRYIDEKKKLAAIICNIKKSHKKTLNKMNIQTIELHALKIKQRKIIK